MYDFMVGFAYFTLGFAVSLALSSAVLKIAVLAVTEAMSDKEEEEVEMICED